MKIRINIVIVLSLFLFACKGNERNTASQTLPEKSDKQELTIEAKSEVDQDFSKSAAAFAKKVLNENLRTHVFDISELNNPTYIKIFITEEIVQVKAYSNKNISAPNQYADFTLFVATYNNTASAKNAFERIIADTQHYNSSESSVLDIESNERVQSLNLGGNYGGLITQNGKQVFSLVEVCEKTPIAGNWLEYEYLFTNCITNTNGDIQVLKAGCGESKYYGGTRKASLQQCL